MKANIAFVVAVALLSGCGTKLIIQPPVGPLSNPSLPLLEASSITIPVSIRMDALRKLVEQNVPPSEDHEGLEVEVDRVNLAPGCLVPTPFGCAVPNPIRPTTGIFAKYYWERSPITLSGNGNVLRGSTELRYRLKGWTGLIGEGVAVSCGHGASWPRKMSLNAASDFSWAGGGAYKIVPTMRLESLIADGGTPCDITFLNIGIHNRIRDRISELLGNKIADTNASIQNTLDLNDKANEAWQTLQDPIVVDAAHDIYLLIEPISINTSDFTANGDAVNVTLVITARPKLVASRPSQPIKRPLPQRQPGATGNSFHIGLDVAVAYDDASRILNEQFKGKVFNALKQELKVESVRTFPAYDKIIVEVIVTGCVVGSIYFEGTPVLNTATQEVLLRDFDFTPDTNNFLLNAASWIFHTKIKESISSNAQWSYREALEAQRKTVASYISKDIKVDDRTISLRGTLIALRPVMAFTGLDGIRVHVVADGTLGVEISN